MAFDLGDVITDGVLAGRVVAKVSGVDGELVGDELDRRVWCRSDVGRFEDGFEEADKGVAGVVMRRRGTANSKMLLPCWCR